ncbi:MAG: phosphoenolpyruvate carboxykinase (ATP) [Phycisphaerales bacterium]|nr:phosphoenolpyruvate carboxykinase (ATP) [Phycisphaerales bacterium]
MKYLDIQTPAAPHAGAWASAFELSNHGLPPLKRVYWNLRTPALVEEAIFRGEGHVVHGGPLVVHTGKHTARAAADKFIVREESTESKIWWGEYNRPFDPAKFNALHQRIVAFLAGEELFVQDCYAGADPQYRLPIRIITDSAWHSLFARNMFIPVSSQSEAREFVPDFTIIAAPSFRCDPRIDGTRSETAIILNFGARLALICNTQYAGEIKKSIFTLLNFLLPNQGVLAMHCSANVGRAGDVALFFGLSGTGKTTLSADPNRRLIGDDEHGWSDNGVFNFEGGCYAKVIRLSEESEPQIYAATRRFGTILENVSYDLESRRVDLDDDSITENTRASYPLEFIPNVVPERLAPSHPKNILFLTCDASGVLPPISRLTPEQAMYHFISGYTSKIAGTEIGLGKEPKITFSACFGAVFMVHHPMIYAGLLAKKMAKHGATCWLVNTGWSGGPYGVGKRISIKHTRALLNAALDGKLAGVPYQKDKLFGFELPKSCPDVPPEILDPANTWASRDEYWNRYDSLAARFADNFKIYAEGCSKEVVAAGPKRLSQL